MEKCDCFAPCMVIESSRLLGPQYDKKKKIDVEDFTIIYSSSERVHEESKAERC